MTHHEEMESHVAAHDQKLKLLEAASVALVAEFIGAITGLRPPLERNLFPPEYEPGLRRFVDGMVQLVREFDGHPTFTHKSRGK